MTTFDKRVVVKLGGSLLAQPSLPERLSNWLQQKSESVQYIFIVGGGPPVEGLRQIDRANQIAAEISHWLAIQLMDSNASILQSWFPEWKLNDEFNELSEIQDRMIIFRVEKFLRQIEPNMVGTTLPIGWQTTSDAIAARLAECLQAELILLKSVVVEEPYDWKNLVEKGIVDPVMASMADNLTVKIETLPTAESLDTL